MVVGQQQGIANNSAKDDFSKVLATSTEMKQLMLQKVLPDVVESPASFLYRSLAAVCKSETFFGFEQQQVYYLCGKYKIATPTR
jgi:hypothetical protein